MGFKEQVAADVLSTFLAHDDFATLHNIDGRQLWVVVDVSQEGAHIYNAHPPSFAEGVSVVQIVFYVDPLELGYRPEEDQEMEFDGRMSLVKGAIDEDGLYKITIERNRG